MFNLGHDIFIKCQNDLETQGHFILKIELPSDILSLVRAAQYDLLDIEIEKLTHPNGLIFNTLSQFENFQEIEHIISLREAKNEWEEDGIWHDDGSRKLAFSLSLNESAPHGGVLEIRKKGIMESYEIPTPLYGEMIVFKTGLGGYEHKINRVTQGSRLIIAGWCT